MNDFPRSPTSAAEPTAPLDLPPAADDRTRRNALFIVFLVVVIDLLGFAIVLPLLPRYGKLFLQGGTSPVATGAILGLLMLSFSAMQFFFAPLWGRVSDRIGRRPILLMGLASSVVFYALFGIASLAGMEGSPALALTLLFVSRVGAGIAGATLGTAQAAIADSTSLEGRSRGMAIIGAAFGIGFCFGPILGFGILYFFPGYLAGPGFLAAGLSLIALLLGMAMLPETRRTGAPSTARRTWFNHQGLRTALQVPGVGSLILVFFLATFAFANFEPTLAILTQARALGLDEQHNFLVFAYVGLVLALAQGGLYRPLAKRVSEFTFTWVGSLLMALGLAGVGAIATVADQPGSYDRWTLLGGLLVVLAVAVTGFAFVTPSVQALISRLSDPSRQGEILGVNQSASAMARMLGPMAGMTLYFVTPSHFLPYALGASLLVIVLLLTLRLRAQVHLPRSAGAGH